MISDTLRVHRSLRSTVQTTAELADATGLRLERVRLALRRLEIDGDAVRFDRAATPAGPRRSLWRRA